MMLYLRRISVWSSYTGEPHLVPKNLEKPVTLNLPQALVIVLVFVCWGG